MDWGKAVEILARAVEVLGPKGALIVSIVVGLALVVVIIAHGHGLYGERRAGQQSLDFVDRQQTFVDRLMAAVDKLVEREQQLRADLERQERESDTYRDRATELQVDIDLMRVQLRRVIEMLRDVRDGRLRPDEIRDVDLAEAIK